MRAKWVTETNPQCGRLSVLQRLVEKRPTPSHLVCLQTPDLTLMPCHVRAWTESSTPSSTRWLITRNSPDQPGRSKMTTSLLKKTSQKLDLPHRCNVLKQLVARTPTLSTRSHDQSGSLKGEFQPSLSPSAPGSISRLSRFSNFPSLPLTPALLGSELQHRVPS